MRVVRPLRNAVHRREQAIRPSLHVVVISEILMRDRAAGLARRLRVACNAPNSQRGTHMSRTFPSLLTAVGILVLTLLFGSSVLSAQSRDRIPPTAPTNLVVTATTEHSVSLAWGPSTDNSGRFSYIICCAGTTVTVSQTMTSSHAGGPAIRQDVYVSRLRQGCCRQPFQVQQRRDGHVARGSSPRRRSRSWECWMLARRTPR